MKRQDMLKVISCVLVGIGWVCFILYALGAITPKYLDLKLSLVVMIISTGFLLYGFFGREEAE